MNDDLFDHQLEIPKTDNNIRKLREKTLKKIEKEIKMWEDAQHISFLNETKRTRSV